MVGLTICGEKGGSFCVRCYCYVLQHALSHIMCVFGCLWRVEGGESIIGYTKKKTQDEGGRGQREMKEVSELPERKKMSPPSSAANSLPPPPSLLFCNSEKKQSHTAQGRHSLSADSFEGGGEKREGCSLGDDNIINF